VKLEDGSQHKNLRVWSVSTGQELISFTQKSQEGWDLQYTISESHAVRLVGSDIQVFRPAEWDKGVVDKLRIEGATSVTLSPGLNPSIAVFIAEKKVCILVPVVVDIRWNCFFFLRASQRASRFTISSDSMRLPPVKRPSSKQIVPRSNGTHLGHRFCF